MKTPLLPLCAGLASAARLTGLCSGIAQTPDFDPVALRTNALATLSPLPDKAPGAEKDSPVLVDLGKKLTTKESAVQHMTVEGGGWRVVTMILRSCLTGSQRQGL